MSQDVHPPPASLFQKVLLGKAAESVAPVLPAEELLENPRHFLGDAVEALESGTQRCSEVSPTS